MEKLFKFMQENSSVVINKYTGWNEQADIPGFFRDEDRKSKDCLIAGNGDKLMLLGFSLRRGNHLELSLYHNNIEVERVKLGDFFPDQDVVIATSGEKLSFFAPVCKTIMELIKFMSEIVKLTEKYHLGQSLLSDFKRLALWLYYHAHDKIKEQN